MDELYDVMILGGGAAGLTAGIYSARAKLKTLILNEGAIGGQMVLTNEVANYPGVETTFGYMLAGTMKNQAKSFGCVLKSNVKIMDKKLEDSIKSVVLEDGRVFQAKTVILALGGRPRSLNIPGEEAYKGKGISFCATCDADFFQNKQLVVVGGGNSALEEAVMLTNFASKVTIVHQFDHFQAFAHAVEEASKNPKIDFVMESELQTFEGTEQLEQVRVKHLPSGKETILKTDGVFQFIGYSPNTESLKGLIQLNERNEIIVDADMRTNIPGVFAAGDCINKRYRQVTTAVADGTIAALSAAEYLRNN
ncbi:MAG: FAD-dependent oxidoreductase [Paludibacteraceae bacterium]|nr:FAD-dependent oxidoreductase [Paludibacteraceae bacterium]MBN2787183.1 FAD-dependent oxidoreductase [Paludibacteraceae bacterium]